MKGKSDPRHQHRIHLMQQLFSWDFNGQKDSQISEIVSHLKKIDKTIEKAAPAWPIGQINKIDLAILRLAFFEIIVKKDTPEKVVIDEAVELAKEYGSESSAPFVNGVLGKLLEFKNVGSSKKI